MQVLIVYDTKEIAYVRKSSSPLRRVLINRVNKTLALLLKYSTLAVNSNGYESRSIRAVIRGTPETFV